MVFIQFTCLAIHVSYILFLTFGLVLGIGQCAKEASNPVQQSQGSSFR